MRILTLRVPVTALFLVLTIMAQIVAAPRPGGPPAPGVTAPVQDAPNCEDLCNGWKQKREPRSVVIDANTGMVKFGTLKFAGDDPIQLIFINKNPFKYKYQFQVKTEPLALANVLTFLGLLTNTFPPNIVPAGPQPAPLGAVSQACRDIPVVKALIEKAEATLGKVPGIESALDQRVKTLPAAQKNYNDLLKATEKDEIDCVSVCGAANTFFTQLTQLDVSAAEKQVNDFKKEVADFKTRVEGLTIIPPVAGCSEADVKTDLRNLYVASLEANAARLETILTKYKEEYAKVKASFEAVRAAYNAEGGNPYYEIVYSDPIGEAALVTATIFRKNRRVENATEEKVRAIEIQVGESPISLSAGIGFSTIDEVKIVRQPSPDGMGTRFGRELNSNFKATGVVMLNAHLKRIERLNSTFAFSVGLGMTNRNETASFEFIAGPSLGFINNRFFITIGYSAARVERLGGGFMEGQTVPEGLADPLPVQRNFQNGAMFAFTYKIR